MSTQAHVLLRLEQSLYVFMAGMIAYNFYFMPGARGDFAVYADYGMIIFGVFATALLAASFAALAVYIWRYASKQDDFAKSLGQVLLFAMAAGNLAVVAGFAAFTYAAYHYVVGDIPVDTLLPIVSSLDNVNIIGTMAIILFFILSTFIFRPRSRIFLAAIILFAVVALIDILGIAPYDGFGFAWLAYVLAVRQFRKKYAVKYTV